MMRQRNVGGKSRESFINYMTKLYGLYRMTIEACVNYYIMTHTYGEKEMEEYVPYMYVYWYI